MIATAMEDNTAFTMLITGKADTSIKNFIGMTASDIKKSREIKDEKSAPPPANQQTLKPPQLTPAQLIANSPHMSPFTNGGHFISPQPTFIVMTPDQATIHHHLRKSSNTATPSPNCFIATPHLTPIGAMAFVPQIFFPPDFNNTSISPATSMYPNSFNNSCEFLNARLNLSQMNQSGIFVSPSYNTVSGFPSPCV